MTRAELLRHALSRALSRVRDLAIEDLGRRKSHPRHEAVETGHFKHPERAASPAGNNFGINFGWGIPNVFIKSGRSFLLAPRQTFINGPKLTTADTSD